MTPATEPAPAGALARSLRLLHTLEDLLLTLMLGTMIVVACAQILLRNLFEWNFAWGDPLTRLLVLWVALLGALAASRGNRHISVDLLSHLLQGRARAALQALTGAFTAAICLLVAWHALRFVQGEAASATAGLWGWPTWVFQTIIPLGFALMGLRYLLFSLRQLAITLGRAA